MIQAFTRKFFITLAAAAAATLATSTALAADWPDRPIKLVVPYPAGGLTDIVSRVIGDEVGKVLGASVIIENKSGAGGQVGLESVLRAPKDGYTIALVVPAIMVTLPLTNPAYTLRPLEQFEPITIAVDTFLTLVVDRKLELTSLKDFTAYARKNPGKLNYGTPGAGTTFHFNNVMMQKKLGFEASHVPYQGEVKILNDIAGGVLQYALVSNAGKPFIDSGQVTALAVTAEKRVHSLPKTPTFKEQGVDFASDGWVGYAAAAGTPRPIMDKLQEAFAKALAAPQVRTRLTEMGYIVVANSPAQFRARVHDSSKRYAELIKSGAIKLD
ncbi:MAG TPA: tripartite tricarboxylate transporter substrate binding protein [Ramlibacter sp.]|nr:tripartite tricarboxylate transporter substrate binding protein [Ramlibacter sp.]